MQQFDEAPNLLINLAEQMAMHIDQLHVSEGAIELILLLLLMSHNLFLFHGSLANYLLSYFFHAMQNQRKSYETERELQIAFEKQIDEEQKKVNPDPILRKLTVAEKRQNAMRNQVKMRMHYIVKTKD